MADVIDRYPRCRMVGMRFVLVEAQDRVMQEIPAPLAEFASRELRGRGMEILTGTMLKEMDERSATLSTGERIPTRMLCWTAGVKPAPVVRELGVPLNEHGRIEVDATMKVAGRDNVWAIGDAAAVPDPAKGRQVGQPADLPARDPAGAPGGRERGRRAARPRPEAVPLQDARGVR